MAMLGLKRGTVRLVGHNKKWGQLFAEEKKRLEKALGILAIDIQHAGSTAVPGIPAKPIIDIIVGVPSLKDVRKCVQPLRRLGYEYMPERGDPKGRFFFAKGSHARRTYHVHVVRCGGAFWVNHILFPSYLRENRTWAKKYEILKKKLANKFPNNRDAYVKGKKVFIDLVVARAKKDKAKVR